MRWQTVQTDECLILPVGHLSGWQIFQHSSKQTEKWGHLQKGMIEVLKT